MGEEGLGAALTEREREKRIAEEKQRGLDEQQRQQLDQMQQGMYMMFNPMMTGGMGGMGEMNPMMIGKGWGRCTNRLWRRFRGVEAVLVVMVLKEVGLSPAMEARQYA
jgi:hypothetical protein